MNENLSAFVDKVQEISGAKILEINGRQYSTKQIHPVKDPTPDPITLSTLDSLIEYAKQEAPEVPFVHIASPTEVILFSTLHGDFKQRSIYTRAVRKPIEFPFGRYLDLEEFIVKLQVYFRESEHRADILRIVGNVTDESALSTEDDGITQRVTARQGIKREKVTLPNPVTLFPYRTFLEVEQPESPFIFRMRSGAKDGEAPSCALFPCDGNMWEVSAIARIKEYLRDHLPDGFTVIG